MDACSLEKAMFLDENDSLTKRSLGELCDLWDAMGIRGEVREKRAKDVSSHIKSLFDRMLKEEMVTFENIKKSIAIYEAEREKLVHDLQMADNYLSAKDGDDTLTATLSRIKAEVNQLRQEKAARTKIYEDIKQTEEALCEATGALPTNVSLQDCLANEAQLQKIKENVQTLQSLRRAREAEFEAIRSEIRDLNEKLEREPRSTLERHIICSDIGSIKLPQDALDAAREILQSLRAEMQANTRTAAEIIEAILKLSKLLEMSYDTSLSPSKCCSNNTIKKLKQQLAYLEGEKKKHIMVFIQSAKKDLEDLWSDCYAGDEAKLAFFASLDMDHHLSLDNTLEQYESAIRTWTAFYERNELLLKKVHEWFMLCDDVERLEESMKDPKRLGNFRRLREEEKTRNKVNKKLPALTKDLKVMTNKYLAEHGVDFLINGATFPQLARARECHRKMQASSKSGVTVDKTYGGNTFRWQNSISSTMSDDYNNGTVRRKMSKTS